MQSASRRFALLFTYLPAFVYPLWRNVYSGPSPIFSVGISLFMVKSKSSLHILDRSPFRYMICKYFPSFFRLSFQLLALHCLVNEIHSLRHDFQNAPYRCTLPSIYSNNWIPCQAGLLSVSCHSGSTPCFCSPCL